MPAAGSVRGKVRVVHHIMVNGSDYYAKSWTAILVSLDQVPIDVKDIPSVSVGILQKDRQSQVCPHCCHRNSKLRSLGYCYRQCIRPTNCTRSIFDIQPNERVLKAYARGCSYFGDHLCCSRRPASAILPVPNCKAIYARQPWTHVPSANFSKASP